MARPDFWEDQAAAREMGKALTRIKDPVDAYDGLERRWQDWYELWQLSREEPPDPAIESELRQDAQGLLLEWRTLELGLVLKGPYDHEDAIISLHAGAGGTEAQDWVSMLVRMYLRWAERHGLKSAVMDQLPGEEAGLKSIAISIRGPHAFGFLRPERGVHRLIRMSPFDSSGRRHTSFASVEVMPDLQNETDIEIRAEDLRVDTYRSSGAGGQHVNKTESAVRLTHLPTGLVAACQSERSQYSNRETAMRMLRAKLAELKEREWEEHLAKVRGDQSDIGWGSQIRTYVFQPYSGVRDHRTRFEMGNVQAVMDGEIDGFIEAYLQQEARGTFNREASS